MENELYILWTNDNLVTIDKMVFMYAYNAKLNKWWDNVTVIIWGATARLVANDYKIQKRIKEMIDIGVKVTACKACADQLGVAATLENLDIEVKYWGEPLTEILKSGKKLLSV